MDPLPKTLTPQANGTHKRTHRHTQHYRECLKNHAAPLGTHATDGCGEFLPSPSSIPSDPYSLTCAACGCHRNFHRRIDPNRGSSNNNNKEEEEGGGGDEDEAGSHVLLTLKTAGGPTRKKRFRSRFSKEQKEGMMELAERVGWRLQRREAEVVEEGCTRIGVQRGVFKVWMHNNKQAVLEMKRINNNNNNNNKMMMNCSSSSPSAPN